MLGIARSPALLAAFQCFVGDLPSKGALKQNAGPGKRAKFIEDEIKGRFGAHYEKTEEKWASVAAGFMQNDL